MAEGSLTKTEMTTKQEHKFPIKPVNKNIYLSFASVEDNLKKQVQNTCSLPITNMETIFLIKSQYLKGAKMTQNSYMEVCKAKKL